MGARNVIDAAINQGVRSILALSTDKAVNPISLYGATKLCAEKMFVQANAYAGTKDTRFSCGALRQRGGDSEQCDTGVSRTAEERQDHDYGSAHDPLLDHARPEREIRHPLPGRDAWGEIFVPKIASMKTLDLAESIAPDVKSRPLESDRERNCTKR